ncbi:MAG: hypothetical protein ABSH53_15005 [Holophaga sp.]
MDDDVHPYGLFRRNPCPHGPALQGGFVHPEIADRCRHVPFDILGAYGSMLGRRAEAVAREWALAGRDLATGSHLRDPNADLALNVTLQPFAAGAVEVVDEGACPAGTLGIVQTFLSGDPDLDAKDLHGEFLQTGDGDVLLGKSPLRFVVDRYRPCVLDHDFRVTGAVLGLDNTLGTIPFIPTRLRLEDYLLRAWSRLAGIRVGYCDAVQTHLRSMASRSHLVADCVNEGLATLFKTMINAGLCAADRVAFRFDARPALEDEELRALWFALVEPARHPEDHPGAWHSPFWNRYRELVREQALDLDDPGPFIVRGRARLRSAYQDLRTAMELWPRILAFGEQAPVRPRVFHPAEARQALRAS